MSRRPRPPIGPGRRHPFEAHPTHPDVCNRCPAPERNRRLHPPIAFFRNAESEPAARAALAEQLQHSAADMTLVLIEETLLWLSRHGSASGAGVLHLADRHRKVTAVAIDQALRNLVESGQLRRTNLTALSYDAKHGGGTGHRWPIYEPTS